MRSSSGYRLPADAEQMSARFCSLIRLEWKRELDSAGTIEQTISFSEADRKL
jgi:hypothetical protein